MLTRVFVFVFIFLLAGGLHASTIEYHNPIIRGDWSDPTAYVPLSVINPGFQLHAAQTL